MFSIQLSPKLTTCDQSYLIKVDHNEMFISNNARNRKPSEYALSLNIGLAYKDVFNSGNFVFNQDYVSLTYF